MKRTVVLITGAAGNLGGKLRRHLEARGGYELRLLDLDPRGDAEIVPADLSTYDPNWTRLFENVDVVVHLAANPSVVDGWGELLGPNVDGVLNVHLAAAAHGTPRVVVASSIWAMAARRDGAAPIPADDPDPGRNSYGISKLFAERTARAFAQSRGMTAIVVRIGACRTGENAPYPSHDAWEDGCWLSNADFCQGFEKAISVPVTGFALLNLTSGNRGSRWSLAEARASLGYRPIDRWSPPRLRVRVGGDAHAVWDWVRRLLHRATELLAPGLRQRAEAQSRTVSDTSTLRPGSL